MEIYTKSIQAKLLGLNLGNLEFLKSVPLSTTPNPGLWAKAKILNTICIGHIDSRRSCSRTKSLTLTRGITAPMGRGVDDESCITMIPLLVALAQHVVALVTEWSYFMSVEYLEQQQPQFSSPVHLTSTYQEWRWFILVSAHQLCFLLALSQLTDRSNGEGLILLLASDQIPFLILTIKMGTPFLPG